MRRHLLLVLTGPAVDVVQQWRHTWDPAMACAVPAHVTVTYPEETSDENLLLARAAAHFPIVPPFRLRLGEVFAEDDGRGGVFIAVEDIDGGWADLKRHLLAEPMTPIDFPPHVTVAHPRTSTNGTACYAALRGHRLSAETYVREVVFTETTAATFTVLRRFPLAGMARRSSVGTPEFEAGPGDSTSGHRNSD